MSNKRLVLTGVLFMFLFCVNTAGAAGYNGKDENLKPALPVLNFVNWSLIIFCVPGTMLPGSDFS